VVLEPHLLDTDTIHTYSIVKREPSSHAGFRRFGTEM
jgi:hypothetical protein